MVQLHVTFRAFRQRSNHSKTIASRTLNLSCLYSYISGKNIYAASPVVFYAAASLRTSGRYATVTIFLVPALRSCHIGPVTADESAGERKGRAAMARGRLINDPPPGHGQLRGRRSGTAKCVWKLPREAVSPARRPSSQRHTCAGWQICRSARGAPGAGTGSAADTDVISGWYRRYQRLIQTGSAADTDGISGWYRRDQRLIQTGSAADTDGISGWYRRDQRLIQTWSAADTDGISGWYRRDQRLMQTGSAADADVISGWYRRDQRLVQTGSAADADDGGGLGSRYQMDTMPCIWRKNKTRAVLPRMSVFPSSWEQKYCSLNDSSELGEMLASIHASWPSIGALTRTFIGRSWAAVGLLRCRIHLLDICEASR